MTPDYLKSKIVVEPPKDLEMEILQVIIPFWLKVWVLNLDFNIQNRLEVLFEFFREIPEDAPDGFEEIWLIVLKKVKKDIDRILLEIQRLLNRGTNDVE